MGQRVKLGFGLLLCLLSTNSLAFPLSDFPLYLDPHWIHSVQPTDVHPVTVQCTEDKMVVIVSRDLFGTGKLIKATDLSLGPASCKPTTLGAGETVTFEVGLHECGSVLQMSQDSLTYSTYLSYSPKPSDIQDTIMSNSAMVPIQCIYPRTDNESSQAIQPEWAPFRLVDSAEEKVDFTLRLMNDDWSAERNSTVFHLGDDIHFEASVSAGDHIPMTIFVDSCVATISPDKDSSPSYNIIDTYGCMIDGKNEDSSSAFRSPRTHPEKIQFTVDAFRFVGDTKPLIYITCSLKAAPTDQTPDPLHKACSFSKVSNDWSPVEGPSSICSCCETGRCGGLEDQSREKHSKRSEPSTPSKPWKPFFPIPRRTGRAVPLDLDLSPYEAQLKNVVIGPILLQNGEKP